MLHKIEKNTVEETLVIPLYSRKKSSELYSFLYKDKTAEELIKKIDYDFSSLENNSRKLMCRFGFLEVGARQNDLSFEVKEYLKAHPYASVVNLGAGLDGMPRTLDNGKCKIYNIDYPDVIKVRNELLPTQDREQNLAFDLNDTAWFDKIDSSNGVIFFASGVFYYFLARQVETLVQKMASRFKGGVLVFDAANKRAVKLILKTWLKWAKIKDVGVYFSVSNAKKELSSWSENIVVSSKGYMLGYNDLKDPSLNSFFRFLSKVGDNLMKMQIVKIEFK